jgi:hypothetical protein
MVAKIVIEKEPEALWELLPPKIKRDMALKSETRGELETPAARLPAGEKAFRIWAPRVYNESLANTGDTEEDEAPTPRAEKLARTGGMRKAPSDEDATERAGYYAYLNDRFRGLKETKTADGSIPGMDRRK